MKIKINIKPLILHINKIKKIMTKSDNEFAVIYGFFYKEQVFDNLLAMICYFWINRSQNTLDTKINIKNIKKASFDEPKELLNIFKEIIIFASEKKVQINNDNREELYFNFELVYKNYSEEISKKITEILAQHSIKKSNELDAIKECLESLINFNLIDLHTDKIKVLKVNESPFKYDKLVDLIDKQVKYISNSYLPFKKSNSPNFNFIFKTILTLRKRMY